MSIAITDDHRALAETASDFLLKRDARGAARALLEADAEPLPEFWADLSKLGWLGLHLPEEHGGSGYGLEELVVVVEELGRAVAPGPFVPSAIVSAVLVAAGDDATKARLLPGLADGSTAGAVALGGHVELRDGAAHGDAGVVLGAGGRHRRRPALLRRRGGRHPRGAGSGPVRQPEHPGARRDRHHLGARRPPLHAPGHHPPALPAGRRGGPRPHRPHPAGG